MTDSVLSTRRDLDALVAALPDLSPVECTRLHAFWASVDPDVRHGAHVRAREAAARFYRQDLIRVAQDAVVHWSEESRSRGTTGWGEQWVDPDPDEKRGGSGRAAAVPAIVDAALALALRDVLAPPDFDVLFDPWLDAIGLDALGPGVIGLDAPGPDAEGDIAGADDRP